ncbi:MAG: hypothetical protein C5B54_09985 [Acidobacteria bacterium]|nr:MAG: hypothetical protein C5B54_09985 [Acidobacteriota bacterium]
MSIRGIDGGISSEGWAGVGKEHTVQQGETINSIANQYQISSDQLLKLNPQLSDPNALQPGQVLNLPGSERPNEEAPLMFQADTFEKAGPDLFGMQNLQSSPGFQPEIGAVKLMPNQFQTDASGKMVVSNSDLIGMLRNLVAQNPGESASLNFTRLSGESHAEVVTESRAIQGNSPLFDEGPEESKIASEGQFIMAQGKQGSGEINDFHAPGSFAPESQAGSEDIFSFDHEGMPISEGRVTPGETQGKEVGYTKSNFVAPGETQGKEWGADNLLPAGETPLLLSPKQSIPNASAPGGISVQLTPDLFTMTSEGNLLINNDQLGELLKSAVNQSQPGDLIAFSVGEKTK